MTSNCHFSDSEISKIYKVTIKQRALFLNDIENKLFLVVLVVVSTVLRMAVPVLVGVVVDYLIRGSVVGLMVAFGSLAIAAIISSVAEWCKENVFINSFSEMERRLKYKTWNAVSDMGQDEFLKMTPAMWVGKIGYDSVSATGAFRLLFSSMIPCFVSFAVTLALLAYKHLILACLLTLLMPLGYVFYRVFAGSIDATSDKLRVLSYRQSGLIFGLLEIHPLLRMMGLISNFSKVKYSLLTQVMRRDIYTWRLIAKCRMAIDLSASAMIVVIVGVSLFMCLRGFLSVGEFVAYSSLVFQLVGTMAGVMSALPQMRIGLNSCEAIFGILNSRAKTVKKEKDNGGECKNGCILKAMDAAFGYPNSGQEIIRGLSLDLKQGDFACIFGENGSGKSTLVNLLAGVYAPSEGRILHGDIRIGVVPQHVALYPGTLLENVRLMDKSIGEQEVLETLLKCGFRDFDARFCLGVHTQVEESQLSGGEIQIIGIARALVRNPRLLILDEITNNLDFQAKDRVLEFLAGLGNQMAIVCISHDVQLLDFANRVMVLSKGRLVELSGDKGSLLQKIKIQINKETACEI